MLMIEVSSTPSNLPTSVLPRLDAGSGGGDLTLSGGLLFARAASEWIDIGPTSSSSSSSSTAS